MVNYLKSTPHTLTTSIQTALSSSCSTAADHTLTYYNAASPTASARQEPPLRTALPYTSVRPLEWAAGQRSGEGPQTLYPLCTTCTQHGPAQHSTAQRPGPGPRQGAGAVQGRSRHSPPLGLHTTSSADLRRRRDRQREWHTSAAVSHTGTDGNTTP